MKREYKPERLAVRKLWPLFCWEMCCVCGYEYRREMLWRVKTRIIAATTHGIVWMNEIVCGRCADTKEKAYLWARDASRNRKR